MFLLNQSEEMLCKNNPRRRRSHFLQSYFIQSLGFQSKQSSQFSIVDLSAKTMKPDYKKAWKMIQKIQVQNILELKMLYIPINRDGCHWFGAAIYMDEKKIQIFDSCGYHHCHSFYLHILQELMNYIHRNMNSNSRRRPPPPQWEHITCQPGTPRQLNGHDCGVFTCIYADFLASNRPLTFHQMHIDRCRNLIALSMITKHSIGFNYHVRNLFDYLKETLV